MTYWTGSKEAIEAACITSDAKARDVPESRDGVLLPKDQWITQRWAYPQETATPGVWAIPAYPRGHTPAGCSRVADVKWPAPDD